VVEDLEFVRPYQRVTLRLAHYIHELCKMLTVNDVAKHLGMNWKAVKNIDKAFLEAEYGQTDYSGLRVLAVDEIAIRKGHQYMTVVLNYETGRVVWMAEGRSSDTLKTFFHGMTKDQIQGLEAIAMDMWDPYIKAVREAAPHVKIVFDLFHVVAAFSRVIDAVRLDEYKNASRKNKNVFKGAKYLLLKNRSRLKTDEKTHLAELLNLNRNIFIMMILKEKLKEIWKYRRRGWARKALTAWCAIARLVDNKMVDTFARRLEKYACGIINHCQYPIHTSRLEGVNNKIKIIKRKAYGFHDNRYFTLKVKQAFNT
jgi:transposase